jgi:cytochrome P450
MVQFIQDKKAAYLRSESGKVNHAKDILDMALLDPDYDSSASLEELVDQMRTFFFAGHDTTASAISWALYFLSSNPTELERLRKELDEVFGVGTTPSQVSRQIIEDPKIHMKLEFTLAVVKESLRLEPPASTARTAPKNYFLKTTTGATIEIPEGSMVYVTAWLLHHKKSVWGEDADEFRPGRFLAGNPIPWGYIPFGKRPRDCIGMNLAYLEVVMFRV